MGFNSAFKGLILEASEAIGLRWKFAAYIIVINTAVDKAVAEK
jgi:hypothetical protein